MSHRFLVLVCVCCLFCWGMPSDKPRHRLRRPNLPQKWTPPRTQDGHPDLQGILDNSNSYALERPPEFAGKPVLHASRSGCFLKAVGATGQSRSPRWIGRGRPGPRLQRRLFDRGTNIVGRRTSLIVDPPDGRVPPLTPEAQKKLDASRAYSRLHPADGPRGPPLGRTMPPVAHRGFRRCSQALTTITMRSFRLRDTWHPGRNDSRRSHRSHRRAAASPASIRQWREIAGHWEGDTLVVETTNFTDKTSDVGAGMQRGTFRGIRRSIAPDRALHARRPEHHSLRIHGRRSHGIYQALDRADSDDQKSRPAV